MKRQTWSLSLLCLVLIGSLSLSSCSLVYKGLRMHSNSMQRRNDKSPSINGEVEVPVTDGSTPEVIAAPEATELPEVTASPEPVAAPEPTMAPEPAAAPEPTELQEPTNTMSPARHAYLEGIHYIMQYDFGYIPEIEHVHFIELSVRQQETGEYCALASTQAMLNWHYVSRSQSELADTMNYIPGFGVYNADALAGLNAEMQNSRYPDQIYQLAPMDRSENTRDLFYQRVITAIANRRPLMYIVLMSDLYANAPVVTHNILGTGWIENPETGAIDYLIVEDPAPGQWGTYGGMKIFPTWQVVQAIENSLEPEYFY